MYTKRAETMYSKYMTSAQIVRDAKKTHIFVATSDFGKTWSYARHTPVANIQTDRIKSKPNDCPIKSK